MKTELPELPPLWSDPPPMGHNGGPELRPRRAPGRPTVDTPEIRDRISLMLLGDGVPLRVICCSPGCRAGARSTTGDAMIQGSTVRSNSSPEGPGERRGPWD